MSVGAHPQIYKFSRDADGPQARAGAGRRPGSTAPECLCWWEGEEMEFPGLKPRYKGGSIPAYSMGTHDVQEVHEEKSQRS